MRLSTVTISLKAYKHRESSAKEDKNACVMMGSKEKVSQIWEKQPHWIYLQNVRLTKNDTDYDERFPGYIVFDSPANLHEETSNVGVLGPSKGLCPSSGLFSIIFEGILSDTMYAYRYKTVKSHEGSHVKTSIGGKDFVLTRVISDMKVPDISMLPNDIWKQINLRGINEIIFLKLSKLNLPSHVVQANSDDVTGDFYCYTITKILYLKKRN